MQFNDTISVTFAFNIAHIVSKQRLFIQILYIEGNTFNNIIVQK